MAFNPRDLCKQCPTKRVCEHCGNRLEDPLDGHEDFCGKRGGKPPVPKVTHHRKFAASSPPVDAAPAAAAPAGKEAAKFPLVGNKDSLLTLIAEYASGSPIIVPKIKVLSEQYAAIRRIGGDGNCFYRSFMFSYLEHILESQDHSEVERILAYVEKCRKTLQDLGYADSTFENIFAVFLKQLDNVSQGNAAPISLDELIQRSCDQSVSDNVVMFFRFVTSGEIQKRSTFFGPLILGLTDATVEQFCKNMVEPMGEECDHVHIIALCDALGVPIRVVYLDQSPFNTGGGNSVNHHDFIPESGGDVANAASPFITLLYRPGHYDILYPLRFEQLPVGEAVKEAD